jgi:TonB C terminal
MAREPHIPLFLWIATALLVHVTGGEGAERAARVLGEKLDVQRFADSVRRHVAASSKPMEVALIDDSEAPPDRDVQKPDEDDTSELEADKSEQTPPENLTKRDKPKPEKPKKAAVDDKTEPVAVEEKKEPQKPKEPEKKKEEEAPAKEMPSMKIANRISVVQHVEDKDQKDNPNAEFIADEANHVKEQTQARITANDQNDPNPTPGTAEQGPSDTAGNAHVTEVAQSEDSPGQIDHAPNEKAAGQKATVSTEHQEQGGQKVAREVAPDSRKGNAAAEARNGKVASEAAKPQAEQHAAPGSKETPESPNVMTSPGGTQVTGEPTEGHAGRVAESERKRQLPPRRGRPDALDFLGLGATGTTAGGINLNLTPSNALAAVGRDQLSRERLADGERRRSKHRGSWHTAGIEKWRASIENYASSVKPGNQTALNTARVPFASYLNQIHNRLHPIFADSFLASLESLPADNPLNKPDMKTNLEIVLDKDEGKIVKMGVTHSSGSTVFDVAALESVQNAAPFGKPPPVIVSPDGKVYLHWEFYRNPYYACSTYFAHPYILKVSPENAPSHLPAPSSPPFGPRERVPGETGLLDRPSDGKSADTTALR